MWFLWNSMMVVYHVLVTTGKYLQSLVKNNSKLKLKYASYWMVHGWLPEAFRDVMVCSSVDTFQHFGGICCPCVSIEYFYPEGRDSSSSKMLNVPNHMVSYPRWWWWSHCLLPCEPYVSYAQNIYKSAITNMKVMQMFKLVFKE